MRRARRPAPSTPLSGSVGVPGDKSVSHRALLLGALAAGRSVVRGINLGEDVRHTAAAVARLGARCELDEDRGRVEVYGSGPAGLTEPDDVLYLGNSGTGLRALLGVCAAVPGTSVLTGDASLRGRPMLRVVAPLRQMGATVDGRRYGNLPPLAVRGGELEGVDVATDVPSAQVKTALLLAGLSARGTTSVTEPAPSRDHTERMLSAAGVRLTRAGRTVALEGGQAPAPLDFVVPGDLSSAMFLLVAAAVLPGSRLTVERVGLNPTRTGALDVLARMGAEVSIERGDEVAGEPVGTVTVAASSLSGTEVAENIPSLIDEVPVLAVAATQAEGETVIRNAGELRVKESDRIGAMAEGLRRLGGDVEALPDGMIVRGPTPLTGAAVESHGDHRVALALAVAGLIADGNVRVEGWSCVNTSFPEFLDLLGEARGR